MEGCENRLSDLVVQYLLEPSILPKPAEFQDSTVDLVINGQKFRDFLQLDSVKTFLCSLLQNTANKEQIIAENMNFSYCVGISALQLFLCINWLGEEALNNSHDTSVPGNLVTELLGDGDCLVTNARNPELLLAAKMILLDSAAAGGDSLAVLTWALRCCHVLASVLEERSDVLLAQAAEIVTRGQQLQTEAQPAVRTLFYLQVARHHCQHYRVKEAQAASDTAAACVGLSLAETGALGRRTKHQVKDVAQFCLDLETSAGSGREELLRLDRETLARDVKLEDELRLESVQYKDRERGARESEVRLSGLQQAVLLSKYSCKMESVAVVDSLASEEISPYLAPVLSSPQAWALHLASLLARSKLEAKESRTVERSLAQMETCVEAVKVAGQADRLRLVHVSTLPPLWEVERSLGKLLLSLGLTKAGLEVFLRLELWEEVIVCYSLLELRHKAAEVIRERLEARETARLWCLLGDATDDLDCYHTALKLSNNRSARAHRSIGLHYYFQKDYKVGISWFEKSLELSSCQPLLILRLAFSAMETENWELAAKSYRNYCSYEMDNFEAWNNLANCYVKLGEKERAWRVLQEAVRCDFDNWKVWDNLMVISVDIGAFNDAIRSYTRILDIKQTHVDNQVLNILGRAILENITDIEGNEAGKLKDKFQKFLARLTVAMSKVLK